MIIATPNSTRKTPLVKALGAIDEFEVIEIKATMLNNQSTELDNPSLIDRELARLIYGREIRPPEFGCSISNNHARKIIANSKNGGMIFEDDARILNSDKLLKLANHFLLVNENQAAVLSLFDGRYRQSNRLNRIFLRNPWIRLVGTPALTVGYVITPLAALELLQANSPVKFLADWPKCRVNFNVSVENLIAHGDESTESTISSIENEFRKRLNLIQRFGNAAGITYLFEWKNKESLSKFFYYTWLPKFYWYLDLVIYYALFWERGKRNS